MNVRLTSVVLMAAGALGGTFARAAEKTQVDVYMSDNDGSVVLLGSGRSLAAAIFGQIGVRINWHTGEPGDDRNSGVQFTFAIHTLKQAPVSATRGALAAASSVGLSGAEITIYEDRLRRFLSNHPNLKDAAAAYVLAHELAHVMQGVPRHSESGIMKAQWSVQDYGEMMFHSLAFTHADVDLIHRGLTVQVASSDLSER